MAGPSQMNRTTDRGDTTAAYRADMVGVHFEANTIKSARVDTLVAGHRPNGLGEHYRSTAVQQPIGLVSTGVHDHAGREAILFDGFETKASQMHKAAFTADAVNGFEDVLDPPRLVKVCLLNVSVYIQSIFRLYSV